MTQSPRTWKETGADILRGVAGGSIIGLPASVGWAADRMSQDGKQGAGNQEQQKGRGAAEWIVTGFSTAIVLFLIVYAIIHASTATGKPPLITAVPLFKQVTRQDGKYVLPIRIRNETRPTVQDTRVVVRIVGGRQPQNEEIIVRYLPEHSQMMGYVILDRPPSSTNVRVEVQSFRMS